MITYGQSATYRSSKVGSRCMITASVSGYATPEEAAYEVANTMHWDGWTPRRFWQFWRWTERISPAVIKAWHQIQEQSAK